jgi:nitroreductase
MIDLFRTRRSVRRFLDKKVETEIIDELIKNILTAPSSRGLKSAELITITEKEILSTLSECRGVSSSFIKDAPLGIAIIADPNVSDVWTEDAAILAIFSQLAAHSLGLGSCWIQVRNRVTTGQESVEDYVKKALKIPDTYRVMCLIAIGYSAEEKAPHDEEKLKLDKVHKNQF